MWIAAAIVKRPIKLRLAETDGARVPSSLMDTAAVLITSVTRKLSI